MKLLSDPITMDELKEVIERILDSPFESDKWRGTLQYAYVRMGGTKRHLVPSTYGPWMPEVEP